MNYFFITEDFENEILENVVHVIFPNLNSNEQNQLNIYLVDIVDIICIKFCFDETNKDLYLNQFRE